MFVKQKALPASQAKPRMNIPLWINNGIVVFISLDWNSPRT